MKPSIPSLGLKNNPALASLKNDPEMAPVIADIEKNGQAAMFKYVRINRAIWTIINSITAIYSSHFNVTYVSSVFDLFSQSHTLICPISLYLSIPLSRYLNNPAVMAKVGNLMGGLFGNQGGNQQANPFAGLFGQGGPGQGKPGSGSGGFTA